MKLVDEIYTKLKTDVFKAAYKPNELIVERDIMEKYGISKISAGKVLNRLCHEGHLTSYPRSGYMVTMLTPLEMKQLKRLRISVESLVLEIIAEEVSEERLNSLYAYVKDDFSVQDNASAINNDFHMALAKETNDRYVISLMDSLLGSASRVEQPVAFDHLEGWQSYHRQIIESLKKRDLQTAKDMLFKDINQR